jgi:quinol monooxygenase YgiN
VTELLGIARFKFKEGKREEYKRLSAQAMEIVRTKDSGTLQYDTYFNDDQSECIVIERYRDSEAAIEHAANLADVSAAVSVSRVQSSERSWPTARFLNSSRPTSRCRTPLGAGLGSAYRCI